MPSLKTIGQQASAAASISKLQGNFDAVWHTPTPSKVSHDGHGVYSYDESGGNGENVESIRTIRPLDPLHKDGMSTFAVTIVDTGEIIHNCHMHVYWDSLILKEMFSFQGLFYTLLCVAGSMHGVLISGVSL